MDEGHVPARAWAFGSANQPSRLPLNLRVDQDCEFLRFAPDELATNYARGLVRMPNPATYAVARRGARVAERFHGRAAAARFRETIERELERALLEPMDWDVKGSS